MEARRIGLRVGVDVHTHPMSKELGAEDKKRFAEMKKCYRCREPFSKTPRDDRGQGRFLGMIRSTKTDNLIQYPAYVSMFCSRCVYKDAKGRNVAKPNCVIRKCNGIDRCFTIWDNQSKAKLINGEEVCGYSCMHCDVVVRSKNEMNYQLLEIRHKREGPGRMYQNHLNKQRMLTSLVNQVGDNAMKVMPTTEDYWEYQMEDVKMGFLEDGVTPYTVYEISKPEGSFRTVSSDRGIPLYWRYCNRYNKFLDDIGAMDQGVLGKSIKDIQGLGLYVGKGDKCKFKDMRVYIFTSKKGTCRCVPGFVLDEWYSSRIMKNIEKDIMEIEQASMLLYDK